MAWSDVKIRWRCRRKLKMRSVFRGGPALASVIQGRFRLASSCRMWSSTEHWLQDAHLPRQLKTINGSGHANVGDERANPLA